MENVLDVYKRPYTPANPVVCMDESPKQLIEMRDSIPVKPGREARRSQYIHGKRAAEREKDGGSNHYKDKSGLGSFYQKDIR